MTVTADRVVFDAEPLVAHAAGEAGSRAVAGYLEAVATQATAGFVGSVTLAEVRYTLARKYDRGTADEYLEWLEAIGIESVEADAVWRAASGYVLDYNPALGDAFALAAAEHCEATLLVGADDDYDGIDEPPVVRFRDSGVDP